MIVRTAWLLLFIGPQVRGQVIVNTIGVGRFATQIAVGRDGARNIECAVAFKPHSTFKLNSIAVPLSTAEAPAAIALELAADAGAPGTAIERLLIKGVRASEPTIYSAISVTHPLLEAYQQYWIVLRAASSTQLQWWNTSDSWATLWPEARREAGRRWGLIYTPSPPGLVVTGQRSRTVAVVFRVN